MATAVFGNANFDELLGVKTDYSFNQKPRANHRTKQSNEPKPFSFRKY
jgi:hypothetical protein